VQGKVKGFRGLGKAEEQWVAGWGRGRAAHSSQGV
jgi:hypothetical protein